MLVCVVNVQSAMHEWYHNGKKILSCKDYDIKRAVDKKKESSNQMIAMMEISNVDSTDYGVYTCVATNIAGSISTSCFLGNSKRIGESGMRIFRKFPDFRKFCVPFC